MTLREACCILVGFVLGMFFSFKFAGKCVGLAIKQLIRDGLLRKG